MIYNKIIKKVFCVLIFSLFGVLNIHAQTTSNTSLTSKATVDSSCVIKSLSSMSFGNYIPMSGNKATASNAISFNCTKGVNYTITPNTGLNNGTLKGAKGDSLTYGLYSDASMSVPFGVPTGSQSSLPSVGSYICFNPNNNSTTQPKSGTFLAINSNYSTQYFTSIFSTNTTLYMCNNSYRGWYVQVVSSNPSYNMGCSYGNCGTTTVSNNYTTPNNASIFYVPLLSQGISGISSSVNTNIVKTIYGEILGGQDAQPDIYNDVITLTIAF